MSGFFNSTLNSGKTIIFLVISGQSNAVGTNSGPPSAGYLNAVIPKTKIWTGASFDPLQFGVNNSTGSGHAIELNFGYLASFDYDEIYIVKTPVGNTYLADDGDPALNWSPNGDLYGETVTKVNTALNNLSGDIKRSMLFNFYWNQGENDATDLDYSNAYEVNLQQLIDNVRVDFTEGQKYKFVCTRMQAPVRPFSAGVRSGQENVVANTTNSFLINQDDFVLSDTVHFNSASQNLCAERVYNVIKR